MPEEYDKASRIHRERDDIVQITPYTADRKDAVIELAIQAWTPVFEKTQNDVPRFVYDNFYPDGWAARQTTDVSELLETSADHFWVALSEGSVVGFVGIALHPEDCMGEVTIIAVSPRHQRSGIGRALMDFAGQEIRNAGMQMVMVETVGDSGHAPARSTYEALGYERWPVARYFKPL